MIETILRRSAQAFARRRIVAASLPSRREGGVAVSFALLCVALLMVVAIAIDISRLLTYRSMLNDAADAAALAAVNAGSIDVTLSSTAQATKSKNIGTAMFNAEVPKDVAITALAIDIVKSGATMTATVSYTGTFASTFGPLLPPIMTFSGSASSSYTATYIDIHVLIDVSQSMGLGADAATQTKMATDPKVNYCAFACHGTGGASDMVVASHNKTLYTNLLALNNSLTLEHQVVVLVEATHFSNNKHQLVLLPLAIKTPKLALMRSFLVVLDKALTTMDSTNLAEW